MSWGIVAAVAGTVVSTYGVWQQGQQADAARADAEHMSDAQLTIMREQLDFQKQQYADWEDTYGPIEDRLANFYEGLTPEQLISTGLTNQQQAFQQSRENFQRSAAQRGINSPASFMIEQNMEMQNAMAKANVRTQAPLQVAQAQQGFLAAGRGQNPAAQGVAGAYSNMAGVYGQQAGQQMQTSHTARQGEIAGYQNIAQGLGNAAYAYSRYQNNSLDTYQDKFWNPNYNNNQNPYG